MKSISITPPISDLNQIIQNPLVPWCSFKNSKILIYGGTGFVGSWLTSALRHASVQLDLGIEIEIVTRNVLSARAMCQPTDRDIIKFIEHDFAKKHLEGFFEADYIFHAATPTRTLTGASDLANLQDAPVNAARHAIQCKSPKFGIPMVVHLSSGAVYGQQSMEITHRSEDDNVASAVDSYGKSKLAVDRIFHEARNQGAINFQSPRLFAFAGPLLQLDAHFAVGNFLLDGVLGKAISVNGNPHTLRSYMHPLDLTASLLVIATQKNYLNLNVGSEESISMMNLAHLISRMTSNKGVNLNNLSTSPSNYVPATTRLKSLLPGHSFISLEDSLSRWIEWINFQDFPTRGA
jgi:dTDP-glucose 4,6-dehydratase